MKNSRCANAYDCYINLKESLEEDGTQVRNQRWLEWEADGDDRILNKTPFKTNRTFIGLGTEHKDEFDTLIGKGHKHIIFTDREDIPDMRAIPATLKLYQIEGQKNAMPSGKYQLHTSELPCACSNCRNHEPIDLCIYKNERKVTKHTVSNTVGDTVNAQQQDDEYGLQGLTVNDLKNELRERGLPLSGLKQDLLDRLKAALQDATAQDDDYVGEELLVDENNEIVGAEM